MNLTETQQARHDRILDVAGRLASEGGYDAVQMRAVAADSEVALGTLYRYFPSKEHLLVSALLRQIGGLSDRLSVRPAQGASAEERVVDVLRRANAALRRRQDFTVAVIRALAAGDEAVAPVVRDVRELMGSIIREAAGSGDGDERMAQVAQILQEVWLSALVAWISGVEPAESVDRTLARAAHLLLEGRP